MSRRAMAALAVAVAMGSALAGCASSAPGDLNASAQHVLVPAVRDVRVAAASDSYGQLRAAVARLKSLVAQELRAGDVSPARATAIEDAADTLLQDAQPPPSPPPSTLSPSPTPTLTSTSPTPTPTPTPTSASPTPTPTDTGSPVVSVSAGAASLAP